MDPVILVTGANGFVGRHLIRHLSTPGNVRIVATDVHEALMPFGVSNTEVEYLSGDLSDRSFMERLANAQPFNTVVHLAAVLSQAADMQTYFSIMNSNIQATFLLLEAAKQKNARVIFPSTALVYGGQKGPFREDMPTDPSDFYALSKSMCEQLIRFYGNKYGVRSVIFRIGILYGPSQTGVMFIPSLVSALLSGKEFPMTPGEQTRDFVFIGDFIQALRRAIQDETVSGVFNIGTGHAPTLKETAPAAEKVIGAAGKIKLGALPYREHESWEYCLNSDKAGKELGWLAVTGLEEGLSKTVEYVRQQARTHA
ncbi:MAG: NAD(P)-dependent oxidoreductase [Fibrobacterota bacterium]